jgi:hypothetical protein
MNAKTQAAIVKLLITQKCVGLKCLDCPFNANYGGDYEYNCTYPEIEGKNNKALFETISN